MRKILIIAALSLFSCMGATAAFVVPEEASCSPPFELSEVFERHELLVTEAVTVPATPVEVSVSETISNYTASVSLIDLKLFYRPIIYESPDKREDDIKALILSRYKILLNTARSRASPSF